MAEGRLLVAIAHHGTKNAPYLQQVLAGYRSMDRPVHIVVISDTQRTIPGADEVLVGAPTADPWSLPFRHRELFAQRHGEFDLFIYSEDDVLVTDHHVRRFVELSKVLPPDRILGFLLHEVTSGGERSYCDFHSGFHWEPGSVEAIGGQLFARFTNPHSAFYMLTADHLQRCIESGSYLVPPHRGDHDMLVAAATDPYVNCGMRKVIAVDEIRDLAVHHLPDRYVGRWGMKERDFQVMVEAVRRISEGEIDPRPLVPALSLDAGPWQRLCHVPTAGEILERLPLQGRVLIVGAGSGVGERALVERGLEVTCIPQDNVLGALTRLTGAEVLSAPLDRALAELRGRTFEAVVADDLVGRVQDPPGFLADLAALLADGGELLVSAPNPTFYRLAGLTGHRDLPVPSRTGLGSTGLSRSGLSSLLRWVVGAGLRPGPVISRPAGRLRPLGFLPGLLRSPFCENLIVVARRRHES